MWPILLKVGPVTLHTYGLLVALGFFAGYAWLLKQSRRNGLSAEIATDLVWVLLLSGILGARLLYVLFHWRYYLDAPLDILKLWQGGLVWSGGLLCAMAAGALWLKRRNMSLLLAADLAAPAAALGHAVGRLGCFAAGCCYGRPSDLPWAVTFRHPETLAPANTPLHPSQLYESGLNLLLFAVLASAGGKPALALGRGRLAVLYLALYGVLRFLVELFRGDDRGPVFASLTSTQWVAVACVLAAAGAGFLLPREKRG